MADSLRISPLYEERFGVRVALLDTVTAAGLEEVLNRCAAEEVRLLIARCATEDMPTVHALEAAGCRLMDTLLYFRRSLAEGAPPAPATGDRGAIRPARPEDAPRIEKIAADAFSGYGGHFHADPRLDRGLITRGLTFPFGGSRLVVARKPAAGVR